MWDTKPRYRVINGYDGTYSLRCTVPRQSIDQDEIVELLLNDWVIFIASTENEDKRYPILYLNINHLIKPTKGDRISIKHYKFVGDIKILIKTVL